MLSRVGKLWEAVRTSQWHLHPEGDVLMCEGSPDDHLYVVANGRLKVMQRGKLLNMVSPGECCGEMAYARRDGSVRSATVTALEPTWASRRAVARASTRPSSPSWPSALRCSVDA